MKYTLVGATAKLYSPYGKEKYVLVGYHYYLYHLLAQGAQPTFSFNMEKGDNVNGSLCPSRRPIQTHIWGTTRKIKYIYS